jgi:hypothetical protein
VRRLSLLLAVAAVAVLLGVGQSARADYEYTAESAACGYPRFYPPATGRIGSLADSYPVRGPAGALFGRTIGAVRSSLVWWTMPGGARAQVHRLLLPVLADVEDNLLAAAIEGREYRIRDSDTYGFNARTSVSHDGISFHGLGAAIDVNSATNPYRLDGKLITDMPEWFVAAWEEAGMCWGGSWTYTKDPMHFSWVGPKGSPAYDSIPAPLPPLTDPSDFATPIGSHPVVFGDTGDDPVFVTEASGDGATDVARIRPWRGETVLELATSRRAYSECSIWRWMLDEVPDGRPHMADVVGDGRADLIYVAGSQTLTLTVLGAHAGYEMAAVHSTEIPADGRLVFGDYDGDGADDLWVVEGAAGSADLAVWSAASGFEEKVLAATIPGLTIGSDTRLVVADRDVDGRGDLFVIDGAGEVAVVLAANPEEVSEVSTIPALGETDRIGLEDYDGDGRPDLIVLDGDSTLTAWAGNTPLTTLSPSSWFVEDDFECPEETPPYHFDGIFADDEGSEFEGDIEWLAETGITRGCNPPFQDRFCPDSVVTRGQMAAFLARALRLPSAASGFVDTGRSEFAQDIGSLALSGITRGCNPPINDRFCPDDPVTRGQMAAFLTRALGLSSAPSPFVDDDGSVFEADIAALAASGITRGCNPPTGDRFCADDPVTRAQMAAFLHRAGDRLPG